METTDTAPDRSGAIWVTATGAVLLFAAAVTFVAVRWDDLASWQKFAALVGVTLVLLVGGRLGRRRVPATAAAIWSLGVVLIPLDAWTIAASGDGTWRRGLLAGGLVAGAVVPLARRGWDTVALRWAAILSLPFAAAGVAANTSAPVSCGVLVALAGVLASSLGARTAGRTWLGLASTATLVAAAESVLPRGRGVLAALGLVASPWVAVAVGALVVAGAIADGVRNRRVEWVWMLGIVGLADVVVGLVHQGVGFVAAFVGAATVFLLVEVVGLATAGDAFWRRITSVLADVAEVVAGSLVVAGVLGGLDDLAGRSIEGWTTVAALAIVVLGWLVADLRGGAADGRVRSWTALFTGPLSIHTSIGVLATVLLIAVVAPVDAAWFGAILLATGALWLLTERATSIVLGTAAVCVGSFVLGVLSVWQSFVGLGLLVAVIGVAAFRRTRVAGVATVLCAGTATVLLWQLAWSYFWAFEESSSPWATVQVGAALVGLVALAVAGVRGHGPSGPAVVPAGFAVVIAPWFTGSALHLAGLSHAPLGLGIAVAAFVLVGAALVAPRTFRPFLYGAAGAHLLVGAQICRSDPGALGLVVAMTGLLLGVVGALERSSGLAANGGLLVLLGTWQALWGYGVTTPEAYLVPLAGLLAVGGWYVRRTRHVSSWLSDVPAIAVLGGGALAVRLDGGAGWHALVAGTVALVAVALGGWRRLAGPLFGGSLLLGAVVVNETFRVTAGVPTWIWLAVGGAALLGAGVTMEAHGLGPIESGRRLVDVIDERFD